MTKNDNSAKNNRKRIPTFSGQRQSIQPLHFHELDNLLVIYSFENEMENNSRNVLKNTFYINSFTHLIIFLTRLASIQSGAWLYFGFILK